MQCEHPGKFPCVLIVERCRYDTCIRLEFSSAIRALVKKRRTILDQRREGLLYLKLCVENEQPEAEREYVISASTLEKCSDLFEGVVMFR